MPVKKNGIVLGVVSSSSPAPKESIDDGIKELENLGFDIVVSPSLYESDRFLAGSDESRIAELYAMYENPAVQYIIQAGGGYGTTRLLNKIDWDRIKKHPKIMIGLSDTTGLQNAIYAKTGIPSWTGFLLKRRFSDYILPETLKNLFAHKDVSYTLNGDSKKIVKGTLIGGCLTLVDALIGTPYMPEVKGAILVLEDVREEPYVIDRLLSHLETAGVFKQVKAVVFGKFHDCVSKNPDDGTMEDVLTEWKTRIKKPVFTDLNYGHHKGTEVFPIGYKATIQNNVLTVKAQ